MIYLTLLFINLGSAFCQPVQFVQIKYEAIELDGEKGILSIPFEVIENYHIQSDKVGNNNLLATKVSFDQNVRNQQFIIQRKQIILLGKTEIEVVKNFKVILVLDKKQLKDIKTIKGELFYQACDERKCFFPRELEFEIPLKQMNY